MPKIQSIHQTPIQKTAQKKTEKEQKAPVKTVQMLAAPETLRPEDIHAAQQEVGNQVVQRALDKNDRQAALTDEQGNLRREISDQIQQKRGGGSPLPEKVQQEATRKLGQPFAEVRIHTDESADKLSRSIHARAFTIGRDIFFKNGTYAPSSTAGRETLLHELTHVVQQGGKGSASGKLKLGAPDTAHEKEASRIGKQLSSTVSTASHSTVQAHEDDEEVQTQAEEDEIMSQPENVVQRLDFSALKDFWEEKSGGKKKTPGAKEAPKEQPKPEAKEATKEQPKPEVKETAKEEPKAPEVKVAPKAQPWTKGVLKKGTKVPNVPQMHRMSPDIQSELKSKAGKLKSVEGSSIEDLEKKRAGKFKEMQSYSDEPTKEGKLARVPSPTEKRVTSREKLMATISNASSKPEDVKAAQEKLDTLHKRSKMDTFKSFFKKGGTTKSYAEQAQETRKKNLLTAAQGGDDEAYKKYKGEEEESEKSSIKGKIKGAFASAGGFGGIASKIGGLIGGAAKGPLAEYKSHFMGAKKEEEGGDEKDKKGDKGKGEEEEGSGKSSGSGSFMDTFMKKYDGLVKENSKLQQKIAELETGKKKEEVPSN